MNPITITTLRDGTTVLAKPDGFAYTFANRTQAQKRAESLAWDGIRGDVVKRGRPFYVMVDPAIAEVRSDVRVIARPLAVLRDVVTGAVERGEAEPIVAVESEPDNFAGPQTTTQEDRRRMRQAELDQRTIIRPVK